MKAYFSYLAEMIKAVFSNGDFFYNSIRVDGQGLQHTFSNYGDIFRAYSGEFHFGGWVMFVFFWILIIALVAAVGFGIYLLVSRIISIIKHKASSADLVRQVERLNYELYQVMQERDRILDLKVKSLGIDTKKPDGELSEEEQVVEEVESRFPKLAHVDHEYAKINTAIPEVEGLTLPGLCEAFRNFACSQLGLYYTITTIRQLFAGIGSSKLIILEGISGTGKTSLPYALGKFFAFDANICSVQPNWKDRSELVGYYNEFTKKFNESEFLKALYVSNYRKDTNLIVLDEMNLARIEYYFAEFLSILEMPNPNEWNIEMIGTHADHDPKLFKNGKLKIPQNIVFFGTANNDDSTFTISDKVYDRAICMFFDNKGVAFDAPYQAPMIIPFSQLQNLYDEADKKYPVSEDILNKFSQLDDFVIRKFRLAFGNRILKQLKKFVPCFVACGGTELDGIDFIFTNKILKKFESLNIGFLKNELKELDQMLSKMFGKDEFPMAHAFIDRLIRLS